MKGTVTGCHELSILKATEEPYDKLEVIGVIKKGSIFEYSPEDKFFDWRGTELWKVSHDGKTGYASSLGIKAVGRSAI